MNYLTPTKIVNNVIKYINDPGQNEAIVIDGDWGDDKKFFIQNTLIDKLKKNIKKSHDKKRSVVYISLYKMGSCKQISDELGLNIVETKMKINIKQHIAPKNNIVSKIVATGMKLFNVETSEFPGLSDCFKIRKAIVVFDDLERCRIDKAEVLSYIDDLVEHDKIKVILVGNRLDTGNLKKIKKIGNITKQDDINKIDKCHVDIKLKSNVENIKKEIEIKEIKTKEISINEINECFDDTNNWGVNFHDYCKKHHNKIMSGGKFIVLIDIDKLLEKIITSDTENICEFNRGLDVIYSFSNLDDFFKDDQANIADLTKKLRLEIIGDLSRSPDNKKTALDRTKRKLEESLKLIIRK